MRALLQKLANNENPLSFASRLRRRRSEFLRLLLAELPKPLHILDLGGTQSFWLHSGVSLDQPGTEITLLNTFKQSPSHPAIRAVIGDARNLSAFADKSFSLVFSNSVIEHVGGFAKQQQMAAELSRVGQAYVIQTPNRYFPLEPHYLVPGIQFLPLSLKALLFRLLPLGWAERARSWPQAFEQAKSIRLLNSQELKQLFPEALLVKERFLLLTKSFLAVSGWERAVVEQGLRRTSGLTL